MPQTVPVKTVEQNPRYWLEQLLSGQAITLVDSEGVPVALMVSLKPETNGAETSFSWEEWDLLAERIGRAWKTGKSAPEIVAEVRR